MRLRFFLLRRRPSCMKLVCAGIVTLAELMCLIPSIVPSLEDAHAHSQEGGSTGAGRFLWPLCFVLSQVPFAVANALMERSVKRGQTQEEAHKSSVAEELSLFYFLFGWTLVVVLTVTSLLWLDILPGFGTAGGPGQFAEKYKRINDLKQVSRCLCSFAFGFKCIFGGAGCSPSSAVLGWINYSVTALGCFAFACLMRFSEGANFTIIALTLRTPLVFLFWTLFTEDPFHFEPHVHLSTWLSIAGIVIMLPAILVYDFAPKEIDSSKPSGNVLDDDRQTLIVNADASFEDNVSIN
ncbi:hypothetical protein CAPTEDRAFT_209831 [Capitella teleta]|uniref:EamA domain-containing protein n=1 Tax=Capitella teleta TaxID=283909 RepID=R7T455_CAPTE|nr:hypothetical protein CAPTEDRAFT_209831 [Capitella teleta]|eukprot:ELT87623.1 hypothetical protein CAPTEDRAFT_209831 [Capitella teleta]